MNAKKRRSAAQTQSLVIRKAMFGAATSALGGVAILAFSVWIFLTVPINSATDLLWSVGMALFGAICLIYNTVWLLDRSPQLILNSEGVIDCRKSEQVIPWDSIVAAKLKTTSRRLTVTSATITLTIAERNNAQRDIAIDVCHLTKSHDEILAMIGRLAQLDETRGS